MSQWVIHISGQGEKLEVHPHTNTDLQYWYMKDDHGVLPKSQYRLCDPPERWVDVTSQCELRIDAMGRQQLWHTLEGSLSKTSICIDGAIGYRFSKVEIANNWAFKVENKVQP